jgi:hypothetical protein
MMLQKTFNFIKSIEIFNPQKHRYPLNLRR